MFDMAVYFIKKIKFKYIKAITKKREKRENQTMTISSRCQAKERMSENQRSALN